MSASETASSAAPAFGKDRAEAFALRGRPRPVIRFRKGLIVGLTGSVAIAVVLLAWFSLRPPTFRTLTTQASSRVAQQAAPDALAGAPSSYSQVPRLGPPLPGDLGRPILEGHPALARHRPGELSADAARESDDRQFAEDRQRIDEQLRSARSSPLLVQLSNVEPVSAIAAAPPSLAPAMERSAAESANSDQQHKQEFVRPVGQENSRVSPSSSATLVAGTIIQASLITGLDSDLPGLVIAQVSEDVRDSVTGRIVLVPQGSRLMGVYDAAVSFGQKRALLVWNKIVFPDGSSVGLDKMPATDVEGYSGLEDRIDSHEFRLLKGVALASLLGIGSQLSFGNGNDLERAIRESFQQNGARAGDQIVSKDLDVQPTLKVRPGWPVLAIVREDLVLKPWKA